MLLAAKIALACAGMAIAGAAVLCSEGFVRVDVTQRGSEPHAIHVLAPAMLVPIATRIATHFSSDPNISKMHRDLGPYAPTVRGALGELNSTGDMTLVEISDSRDHVRVEKSGGALLINIEDRDDTVHVSVPIGAISRALRQFTGSEDSRESGDHHD